MSVVIDLLGMRDWLRVLLTPSCWIQLNPYSEVWDQELRRLLADHDFESVGLHTAKLGGITLWIANHPYSSMRPYGVGVNVRASRATILRAGDRLVASLVPLDDQVSKMLRDASP